LPAEWKVEPVGVPGGLYVGYRGAFPQHLQNGVAGNQVDQQEDQRDHEPYYWQHVEDAEGEVAEHLSSVVGLQPSAFSPALLLQLNLMCCFQIFYLDSDVLQVVHHVLKIIFKYEFEGQGVRIGDSASARPGGSRHSFGSDQQLLIERLP
jgi:hypothetical protein